MGQETGLTAMSVAATVYFLVAARKNELDAEIVAAGLAAAVCALSREYGWIAVAGGLVTLIWQRRPIRQMAIFAITSIAAAGPWYVRNWGVTGNPFYSLKFFGFAVNPVHGAILRFYTTIFGLGAWNGGDWERALQFLLVFAGLTIAAGVVGALIHFQKHGYLAVFVVLVAAVWIESIGYTSGGLDYSTRVLSPALALLAILGAGAMDRLARTAAKFQIIVAILVVSQAWAVAAVAVYPNNPTKLSLSDWSHAALRAPAPPVEFSLRDQLVKLFPAGSRVLSDSAYLHAALIDSGIETVPVWSPEVAFPFAASPEEADQQLRAFAH
jgi:hypothetical protein